ncbi:MAG TPA: aminoglycoside phosphotransferase family protein [Bacillales bacterium]|nr:aminoglycoside phosphotransferase family protein [Bacillales bacterium]
MAQRLIETISAVFPEIQVDHAVITGGQNNSVVMVNGEWVFRFPRYAEGVEQLKKETRFLKLVHEPLPVQVPDPVYSSLDGARVGEAFVGYRRIDGNSLKTYSGNKHEIVRELGRFLNVLHGLPLNEDLRGVLGPPDNEYADWYDMFTRMEAKLFVHMNDNARSKVQDNFKRFLAEIGDARLKKTVIHGDFGPSNLLIKDGHVSGVIDFGSVAIGDPARDIASAFFGPFGLGESWMPEVAAVYPQAADYIERARFYASTFALQEALFGIENDDEQAFQAGIAVYK